MISLNLNAIQEWDRIRRDTEPQTPDVDVNPGSEQADRAEISDGSHGNRVRPPARRRRRRREDGVYEESEAYEVDIGQEETGYAPPPDGERAPTESYQATQVDLET